MTYTIVPIGTVASLVLAAGAMSLGCVTNAAAQPNRYIEMGLGMNAAPPLVAHGSDNDWSTKCDLIINPLGLETGGECDSAPPRTSWTNAFGRGNGFGAGMAIGYDWGAVRLELEYLYRSTAYDDRSDTDIFDDVTLDKREQEIEQAYGEIDDLRTHGAFVNVYYDFGPSTSSWTPYVGVGVGGERATLDYRSVWKRNDDPERISTFMDPLLRAKVAGTTTIGNARVSDTTLGYQLLAGVDYRLGEQSTLGIKLRWVDFDAFESGETLWSQLRSHESSVGRTDDIRYSVTTDNNGYWGLGVSLKYLF
ncbi:MAG: outer membrane beta-barrel protein [Rhodospirillaceae bacterium]|nr:outer membrane beta-barrel protein [Rhodospirillaceae bacterium]